MTDLAPHRPDATPAVYDAATLAVLAAMEKAADEHLDTTGPRATSP
ncbi:hypothetical protein [Streptomyces alfalfae]